MALANEDPGAARDLAERWRDRGGAHPADHCYAVALIGLKQYKEAATRLEKLAQAMVRASPALRADVLGQAAQSWLLAGDPARAYAADSTALGLRPDDAGLLVDRAEAAGSAGWLDKAIADLDRVLKADPTRIDALIYRASAYRQLNSLDLALDDAEHAIALEPNAVAGLLERGNIRRLKGDVAGAKADWERLAQLAPDSNEAVAAKNNLARLDSEPSVSDSTSAAPAPSKP